MTARHAAPRARARPKRTYEDDDYAKAVGRMLAAIERRAQTNPDALAYLLTMRQHIDGSILRAGHALSRQGGGAYSLAELAAFMTDNGHSMSRQAAQQRWGRPAAIRLGTITEAINNIIRLDTWRARRAAAGGGGVADERAAI